MYMTILLAVIMMIGLFLLLWAGVGFIQNKKFFSSCPKEVFDVIESKEKRFRGQSLVGWILAIIAILFMGSSIIVGAVDGVQNNFTYIQFFIRFLMILLLLKAFDIVFLIGYFCAIEVLVFLNIIIRKWQISLVLNSLDLTKRNTLFMCCL